MRTGSVIALGLLGAFCCALAPAQAMDGSSAADRGYPAEAGGAVSQGGGAFNGIDQGEAETAAATRGRASASSAGIPEAAQRGEPGETFKSPEAAVDAFIDALRAGDDARLEAIFGPQARDLLSSGDEVADRNERQTFLRHYDRKHSLREDTPEVTLVVGESAWPFAVPIAKGADGHYFDSAKGTKEVVFRRIGRNERNAIAVCSGVVAAQKEYALTGHDGLPAGLYAQKLRSDAGKQNGLFWPVESGASRSPAGPLLAGAADQGYGEEAGRSTPYHGYYFRVLTAQADSARDGAKSYIGGDGRQSGGFALIAYPAEYGRSGVKSFIVNQDSIVYEKDLGKGTLEIARQMREFDPQGWRTAL